MNAFAANRTLRFNNQLDAVVAGTFLVLVSVILVLSVREWMLLLSRRKPAQLRETEPVWLPDYAVAEGGRSFGPGAAGAAALALALAKELSNEAALERAQHQAHVSDCACGTVMARQVKDDSGSPGFASPATPAQLYVKVTEQRFNGIRRCC